MHFSKVTVFLIVLCFLTVFAAGNNNPAYLKSDLSINCGSTGISEAVNGREWIGDTHPKFASFLHIKGTSRTSSATHKLRPGDPVIHKTARISNSPFFYLFHLSPGQKILRLHFNPTSYKGFKKFKDLFTVEAGPFTLLSNFSASLTAHALGVNTFIKEFYISIEENQPLGVIFSPAISPSQDRTYAFINGIEIILVAASLSYFNGGDLKAQVVGQKSLVYIDNTTALEMIHRVNVKRDSLLSNDEFDWFAMRTAVQTKNADDETNNLTWKRLVHLGFRYLVRVHFCKLGLKMAESGNVMFKILINGITADTNSDIIKERDDNGFLWYRDYIVSMKGRKQDTRRDLSISLLTDKKFMYGHELLEGFEVYKLSNPDNSLATPNPFPAARNSSLWSIQNLQSILGDRNTIVNVAITIIALVNIIVYQLRKILEANNTEEEKKPSARAQKLCRRFSLAEMESATKNFSDAFLIGRGGFGKVYKGLIDNEQETVAIKRLKSNSRQGEHEFWTEIETLSELRHINLVSLIGYCNESREMILVYEYMTRGTLADHLHKFEREDNNNHSPLTWKQCLSICIGAGRGLDYLHTGHGVIHRDVKASNILLDENFVAKVSDFGLAKLEDRTNLQSHVSTKIKGTPGYLDPYYFRNCKLTRKSDTYAFGVVLLEVLCRRPAMDRRVGEEECCLTKWAQNKINMGEVNQIIASSLIEEISSDSLKAFVGVAESCLHEEPKKRPTMAQLVLQLEFALEQQESRKSFLPNQKTRVADEISPASDKTILSASTEQQTAVYTNVQGQSNSKTIKTEPQAGTKIMRKIKMYKTLRLWPLGALWKRLKPSKEKASVYNSLSEILEADIKLPKFDLASIAAATNQFSSSNKIGQGGFGSVYKAVLPTGQTVAVKRLSSFSNEGLNEFKREILVVSNLQHRNIIKLLGFCIHGEDRVLVYEFMPNRSLDTHIYDEVRRSLLHWALRFKIITGITRGIIYLHQDSGTRIIHRDLKPSNVLLDIQMNPKISDFGIGINFEDDRSEDISRVCGTYGYLAPEYMMHGRISAMSDVYSFGVVVLEVVAGRRCHTFEGDDQDLLSYAWRLWREGKTLDLVDESLQGAFSVEEALRCIQVGLLCTQQQPNHRPTMPSVLKMLNGEELSMHEKVVEASFHTQMLERNGAVMAYSGTDSDATFEYDSTLER